MSDATSKIDPLGRSKFISLLIDRYTDILTKHLKTPGNEFDINLDNYAPNNSNRLNDILICSLELINYFRDLYNIPKYFPIDASLIKKTYNDNISQTDYYNYTYDNFVMRIVTSIDLCGKIGNLLYDLKIQDRYCNWHTFAFHKQIANTSVSKSLIEISDFLQDFKKERHKKLHWGKTANNDFEYIIIFGGIDEQAKGDKRDEKEIIDNLLQIEISKIKSTIDKVEYLTCIFLDKMIDTLEQFNA